MDWSSFLSVAAGLAVAAVYFYLFNKSFDVSRRVPLGVAQAILLAGYIGRMFVVGALLFAAAYFGKLDQITVALSFMISFTVAFIYTQGQAVLDLMNGRLSEREE